MIERLSYPLTPDVESALIAFLRASYGPRFIFKYPERWKWLYEYRRGSSHVAWDRQRVIGHVGVMPFEAVLMNNPVAGGWSVDTYVAPEFRRRGIAGALQSAAHEEGDCFLSVWTSDENRRIKLRLGDVEAGALTTLQLAGQPLSSEPYLVSRPDPSVIALHAARYLSNFEFYVRRSETYCEWRFVQQPWARYFQVRSRFGLSLARPCGYQHYSTGMIGDVFPVDSSDQAVVAQINITAHVLRKMGCQYVRFASAQRSLVDALAFDGWQHISSNPLLVNKRCAKVLGCQNIFLSLSDQDMDQYPW